jgi:DNA-binding CsgD family transcriptional regulator
MRAEPRRTTLELLIESLTEGAAMARTDTPSLEMNAALRHLLEQEPERIRLERELARVADQLKSLLVARHRPNAGGRHGSALLRRDVRTGASRYRIRALRVGAEPAGGPHWIVLLVERVVRRTFGDAELRDRFHFTPRELQVSRLLATGCSTAMLARTLEISVHTARRHLEHVLAKLGVHSRGAAAALLRVE